MLAEVPCERVDLRWERLRRRIDHVQVAQHHLVIGKHAHRAARGDLVRRNEPRKRADTETRDDRLSDEEEIVPTDARSELELRGPLRAVSGRVLYRDGTPQANARLEIWQANDVGRYAHPGDTRSDGPLDPSFQGYADIRADANGAFRILTIKPGAYPVDGTFERSPHIHFDVRGRQRRLVTQMYFDDTDKAVLAQDKLLQHDMWGKTNPLPSTIFAKLQNERSTLDASARRYDFDIVL